MTDLPEILIGMVVVNQFVLAPIFGPGATSGATPRAQSTLATSLIMTLVLALASGLSWEIDARLLKPFAFPESRLLFFMLVIAATVPLVMLAIRALRLERYQALMPWLPLITINSAVVGAALVFTQQIPGLLSALAWGAGTGVGFSLLLALFARMRERLEDADVPVPFRGAGIALVTAGMVSLAFSGFAGMFR